MHAPQRISCLIVVEFWNGADRSPGGCGMAVLARNVQVSVRTVRTSRCLRLRTPRNSGERQKHHSNQIEHAPMRQHDSPQRLFLPH